MNILLAFGGTALVLTMIPGLDTAIVVRIAAIESRKHGVAAAFGIGLGCLCWGSAVAVGLGAVLATSDLFFTTLRWAGACYLLWLGGKLLMRPRRTTIDEGVSVPSSGSLIAAFRRGLVTNVTNPKVGLFYLTLLPQFVPAGAPATVSLMLTAVHVVLAIVWFLVLAMAIGTIAPMLRRPAVVRRIDVASGCVFVAFAAHLLVATSP